MKIVALSSGIMAISTVDILSVPDLKTISSVENKDLLQSHRNKIVPLLTEIHRYTLAELGSESSSVEIVWTSVPVQGQPFEAEIKLSLIIRCIAKTEDLAISAAKHITDLFAIHLESERFRYEINSTDLAGYLNEDSRHVSRTIVKSSRTNVIGAPGLQSVFAFDVIPELYSNPEELIIVMSKFPHCSIHYQLIPSTYSEEQRIHVLSYNQALSMAVNGMQQGHSTQAYSNASSSAEMYKYYADSSSGALFSYNIVVRGPLATVNHIVSDVITFINSAPGRLVQFRVCDVDSAYFMGDNYSATPWHVKIQLSDFIHSERERIGFSKNILCLTQIVTSAEAASFFRLPIGSDSVRSGLNVNYTDAVIHSFRKGIISDADLFFGRLKASPDYKIGLKISDLTKHMFVCGTPGSGKTSFCVGLLDRLWRDHKIPFLVIEPAKTEYRALIETIPDLQVFTPGNDFVSPFIFNPFIPPKNVKLGPYKTVLKTAFEAGVSMSSPLDMIFERSINNCYSDHLWLDYYDIGSGADIFDINEFMHCFRKTFRSIGYVGEASNIGRAGEIRLESISRMFDGYSSIPIEDMLSKPTVIELAAIENPQQKALLISIILLSILSYVNENFKNDGVLKNVLLLEEAHILLDADSENSSKDANSVAIAQSLVKKILAELRSFGLGMVVCDQSPRRVGLDILALTDIKTVFRVVENRDRDLISGSIGLDECSRLSKFRPGEAYLFFNKMDMPEEIIVDEYRDANNIPTHLSNDCLLKKMKYWDTHSILLKPYPECNFLQECASTCDYKRRVAAKGITRRLCSKYLISKNKKELISKFKQLLRSLPDYVKLEIGLEKYSVELVACVKVHLVRDAKYVYDLKISKEVVEHFVKITYPD